MIKEAITLAVSLFLLSVVNAEQTSLNACVRTGTAGPEIVFTIKNISSVDLRIEESRLPWGSDGAIVVAYKGDAQIGRDLKRAFSVRDPVLNKIELKKAQSLAGSIELRSIFPELGKKAPDESITILWSYFNKEIAEKRKAGAVVFSKEYVCEKEVPSE